MNVNDLMVGDWVSTRIGERGQVGEIYDDGVKLRESSYYDSGFVNPVPLTGEILKKNGWRSYMEDGTCKWYCYKEEGLFHIIKSKEVLLCQEFDGIKLNHVHELQHIFRICGFNELADSFKID